MTTPLSEMDFSEIRLVPADVCAAPGCGLPADAPEHHKRADGGCGCVLADHCFDCYYVSPT